MIYNTDIRQHVKKQAMNTRHRTPELRVKIVFSFQQ